MDHNFRMQQCVFPLYNDGKLVRLYVVNVSDKDFYDVELQVITNAIELIKYISVPGGYIRNPDGFTVFIPEVPKETGVYIDYSIEDPCNMNKNILNYIQILKAETTKFIMLTLRNSSAVHLNDSWSKISTIDVKIKIK